MNQNCHKCRAALPEDARFCPSCGRKVRGAVSIFKPVHFVWITAAALAVFAIVWAAADAMLGSAPAGQFAVSEQNAADPGLDALRAQAEATPDSKDRWNTLAKALAHKIDTSSDAPIALVFELIDVLGRVLKLDARDPEALLGMAEISFSRQAFDKAAEYYRRYLEVNPQDSMGRARYASALTFLGSYEQAITELKAILAGNPGDFHALAYLSIAYAQSGDGLKARETGELALAKAPNQEARARFTKYLEDLKRNATGSAAAGNAPTAGQGTGELDSFISFIRESPLTGPRFRRHELKEESLLLYFSDFPMDKMPDFAREKFISRMKDNAGPLAAIGIRTLVLLDENSGKEMSRIAY